MPISDVYLARVNAFADTTASAVPCLSVFGTAGKRGWIVGVRVELVTTAAAAGGNVIFQLARPGNSPATSTGASGQAQDSSAPASVLQYATAWTTAPTLSTGAGGGILWEQSLPLTTGAAWTEFPPAGYEWGVPAIASGSASAGLHLFITQSSTSSATYNCDLVWSE